jgi:hypothetical protein
MEITEEVLVKAACGVLRKRNQKAKNFFAQVSHYNLQRLGLTSLSGAEAATGARVLYVYDNHITSLEPLARLRSLTQLYAENNELAGLEVVPPAAAAEASPPPPGAPPAARPASALLGSAAPPPPPQHVPLEKAFLKGNRVARVSVAAARALPALRELHLGSQRLAAGAALAFEAGALRVWGRAGLLRLLDVSRCGLSTLAPLAPLRGLEVLRAGGNPVPRAEDAAALLGALPALEELDVRGCDFAAPGANGLPQGRYRDALVRAAGPRLALLDGVEVTRAHRAFLEGKAASAARLAAAGGGGEEAATAAAAAYRAARAVAAALAEEEAPPPPQPPQPQLQLPAWDADGGMMLPEEDGGARAAEDGGEGGEGGEGGALGETLVPAQAAAVRRASLAGEEAAAGKPPLPRAPPAAPRPRAPPAAPRSTEGAAGFISISKNPPVEPGLEALPPRRTPTDFTQSSKFLGGFALPTDRESARMHFEREKERAKVEAMRRTGRRH